MLYKVYQVEQSPTYMQDSPYGEYEAVMGEKKDELRNATVDAILSGLVYESTDDALVDIGKNFNIERPEIFTDDQYRIKLEKAWEIWKKSGTPAGLITAINDLGYPNVTILPEYLQTGNDINGEPIYQKSLPIVDLNPAIEAAGNYWSNFWVIINQPHSFTPHLWGASGKWGSGDAFGPYLWGSVSGSPTVLKRLEQTIKQLKPAWTMCRGIVFLLPGAPSWGNFNYNDGTLFGLSPSQFAVHYIQEEWEI